jgi:hypothetical protein
MSNIKILLEFNDPNQKSQRAGFLTNLQVSDSSLIKKEEKKRKNFVYIVNNVCFRPRIRILAGRTINKGSISPD